MIRLFAALSVPPEIGEGLARRQDGIVGARWRSLEQMHVTLRFFGEVAEPMAEDLDTALAAAAIAPFDLALTGVGAFSEGARARAVWAGANGGEPLRRLAARCETAARRVGLKPDTRAYTPHVTLAYLPRQTPLAAVAQWQVEHALLRSPPWRAVRFGLYSSWRSEEGSRYELERLYPLR